MMSAAAPNNDRINVKGSAFEMFFLDRHCRFPNTEREIKILPMLYFQHQARVKKTVKTVVRIQKWVRAILQKRRRQAVQMVPRQVQFAPKEKTRHSNATTIAALEATKSRLKKKLYKLALQFQQETGRSPKGNDLLATPMGLELRKQYFENKRQLKRARNQLTPCAQSISQTTVDIKSLGEEKKSEEQESVCSPVLHFHTPVASGSRLSYRSPLPVAHNGDDDETLRAMGYHENSIYQTPLR